MILECFAKSFPTKRKPSKCTTKEKKGGGEEKQKVKDERAAKLSRKKPSRNFAFYACLIFEGCNLASGTKASPVLDL